MKKLLQNRLMIVLGWFFVVLAAIGTALPILPTTPFLIVALALFSKSSPRFHHMLLRNAWFGPILKQWEERKTVTRKTKHRACFLIVLVFAISIATLTGHPWPQLGLVGVAAVLLFFIRRLKEEGAE